MRIESLCIELSPASLLAVGIIAAMMGLFLWLGGNYYSGVIVGLLGAALGALVGCVFSGWLGLSGVWCAVIGAALLTLLAVYLRNLVIILAAIIIFALTSGTGYLSYAIESGSNLKNLRQNPFTSLDEAQIPSDSDTETPDPYGTDSLAQLERLDRVGGEAGGAIRRATGVAGTFTDRFKEILSDTWASTSSHRWQLLAWILIGAVVGLLLAWLVRMIVMALCCSIVGTTAIIAGVQIMLMAKGTAMISAMEGRPRVLPAIFAGMVLFGWAVQLFIAAPAKARKAKLMRNTGKMPSRA